MEFRLFFKGELKAGGNANEKQVIRRQFHPQLRALWNHKPLSDYQMFLPGGEREKESVFIKRVGNFTLIPLVAEGAHLVAQLDVTLLRPGVLGSVLAQSGDIDNQLKTLLDALRTPKPENPGEVKLDDKHDENPFYCLLEDDKLVTHLSVSTDRLLVPINNREVIALLHVRVKVTWATINFFGLGL
jgi:hypothetical protein